MCPAQGTGSEAAYVKPVSISPLSWVFASSRRFVSCSFNSPRGNTFTMPPSPNTTFCAKYGKSVISDLQYAHSTRLLPESPANTDLPNLAPAYAMERVALPFPPFASTTSVPADDWYVDVVRVLAGELANEFVRPNHVQCRDA